jgi:hypothetical protein
MAAIESAPKPVEGFTGSMSLKQFKSAAAKWRGGSRRTTTWDAIYLELAKAFGGDELATTLAEGTGKEKLQALYEATFPTMTRNLVRWVLAEDTSEADVKAWLDKRLNLMNHPRVAAAVAWLPESLREGCLPAPRGPKRTWTAKYIAYVLEHKEAITKFLDEQHPPANDRVVPPQEDPPEDPPDGNNGGEDPPDGNNGGEDPPDGDNGGEDPVPVEDADEAAIKAIDVADENESNSSTPTKALFGRYARLASKDDLQATVSSTYKSIVRVLEAKEDHLDLLDQENVRYQIAYIAEAFKAAPDITEELATPKKDDTMLDVNIITVVRKRILPALRGRAGKGAEEATSPDSVLMKDKLADKVAAASNQAAGERCGDGALDPAAIEMICNLKGTVIMEDLIEFDIAYPDLDPILEAVRRVYLISNQPVPIFPTGDDQDVEYLSRDDMETEPSTRSAVVPAPVVLLALDLDGEALHVHLQPFCGFLRGPSRCVQAPPSAAAAAAYRRRRRRRRHALLPLPLSQICLCPTVMWLVPQLAPSITWSPIN